MGCRVVSLPHPTRGHRHQTVRNGASRHQTVNGDSAGIASARSCAELARGGSLLHLTLEQAHVAVVALIADETTGDGLLDGAAFFVGVGAVGERTERYERTKLDEEAL